jgi:hypothetical protein
MLQCGTLKSRSNKAAKELPVMRMRQLLLPLALVMALVSQARAQTGETSDPSTRTMASLLAEGYEMQEVRLFKDKIWMRKPGNSDGATAFICDRGRIGSAAFDAYRNRQYDQVSCSIAQ